MRILSLWLLPLALLLYSCHSMNEPGALVPRTADEDPTLPAIPVNGTLLHAETFGHPDSPMIVMLHGGPGSDYRYMLKCSRFAEDGYFVVFYDQRGAGLSQRHDRNAYSIQQCLDDLTAVIAHYRRSPAQKVFLLGHSWGGMLAAAYLNSYPEAIDGAVIAEPGGFTQEQMKAYLGRSRAYGLMSEAVADALFYNQIIPDRPDNHDVMDYKLMLLSAAEDTESSPVGNPGALPGWRAGAVTFDALLDIAYNQGFDWTTHLGTYTTPVQFVYSEWNTAYGEDHAKWVSSAFPNVQLVRTDSAGHDMVYFGFENFYSPAVSYFHSLR